MRDINDLKSEDFKKEIKNLKDKTIEEIKNFEKKIEEIKNMLEKSEENNNFNDIYIKFAKDLREHQNNYLKKIEKNPKLKESISEEIKKLDEALNGQNNEALENFGKAGLFSKFGAKNIKAILNDDQKYAEISKGIQIKNLLDEKKEGSWEQNININKKIIEYLEEIEKEEKANKFGELKKMASQIEIGKTLENVKE